MPTYTIKSGDFTQVIETRYTAKPDILVVMALSMATDQNSLGLLTQVTGDKLKGKDSVYFSTSKVLEDMGAMEPI